MVESKKNIDTRIEKGSNEEGGEQQPTISYNSKYGTWGMLWLTIVAPRAGIQNIQELVTVRARERVKER